MALSGSISGSILSGNYKLRVDWAATQNVACNTSKITCTIYLVQASSWGLNISSRDDNIITINGTEYTWTSQAISNGGGKTVKLATVMSGNIAHNADGSKSVSISCVFNLRATISGTYRGTINASGTASLTTIPRATQPTLSASSADMGASVTVTMNRASSSFTHDLSYRLGSGSWVSIATGRGASYSWTLPDVATQLPSATSGQLTLRCITKNGSTTIGTKYAYITAKVPASVVPTISSVTATEATSGLAAQFGAYIQNKSKVKVTTEASGAKGSTIAAYQATLLGKTYTGKAFTSGLLTSSGSVTLSVKVKDSRGRWSAAKNVTLSVQTYSAPKVQTLTARRVSASGSADEQGEYIAVTYKYSVTSLNSKNTASAVLDFKKSSESTWTELLTSTALSADTTAKPASPTFSFDYQYDVRLTVTDYFGAMATYTTTLPSGAVILDLLADGKGIAFGKVAEQQGVDFGWDIIGGVNNIASLSGQWQLPGGPLIQWGTVTITPSAAGTPTTASVTYPNPYAVLPLMFLSVVSLVPQKVSVGIVDRTTASAAVVLTRDDTTNTVVNWIAIGRGA